MPDLVYTPSPLNNNFHTFVEIAFFADVHVRMSVDAAQHVTGEVRVNDAPVNLPVMPGDAMSAVMCINTQPSGSTVFYGVANETRGQTVNLSTSNTQGLIPISIDAGITLDLIDNNPTLNKVPRFRVVYFDVHHRGSPLADGWQPGHADRSQRDHTRDSGPAQRPRVQDRLRIALTPCTGPPSSRSSPSADESTKLCALPLN